MDCCVLCAHAWVAVVCTVWRPEVSIRCLLCLLFMLFFLRKGLSLNLRLSDSARLANSGSLPIPTSQSWDHCSQSVWLPTWVLYPLSLLPSPSSQIFGMSRNASVMDIQYILLNGLICCLGLLE